MIDDQGQRLHELYTKNPDVGTSIMPPEAFRRLKAFDPSLQMIFNQVDKKWTILQEKDDRSGYSIVLVLEDNEGNPKPWGEWVLNKLFVFRERWRETQENGGADWRIRQMRESAEDYKAKSMKRQSSENIDRVKDDFTLYKKGLLELQNLPVSDATAGYPKITPKTKEKV